MRWKPGRLDVAENWDSVAKDVTHFGQQLYLTLIDCGPSRFAIWKPLHRQDSANIINQLEVVFCERGPPIELFTKMTLRFADRDLPSLHGHGVYMYYFYVPMYYQGMG